MAIKTKTKIVSKVSEKAAKAKEAQVSELEEILTSEVEGAVEQLSAIAETEAAAQSTFLEAVKYFRDLVEEKELSDENLVTVLRAAYAEIHNDKNPKAKIEPKDLAGKAAQENPALASYVTELKKIKRMCFPIEKSAKSYTKHLNERLNGDKNWTIGSLYREASMGEPPVEAGKKGRKPGSAAGAAGNGKGDGKKGKTESITDLEVFKTEFAVLCAKVDFSEVDIEEAEEAIGLQFQELREKLEE